MSVLAITWAWQQKGINPTDKLVLVALADHSDDKGTCWPGMESIAEKTGLTRRTVINSISRLEETGIVKKQQRTANGFKISNVYTLSIGRVTYEKIEKKQDVNHVHNDVNMTAQGCEFDDMQDVNMTAPRCEADSHKPSIDQPSVKQTSKKQTYIQELPDFIPRNLWDDFISMRKQIKAPLTKTAESLAIKRLTNLKESGQDIIAVMEQTIFNSWKGFFPVKNGNAISEKPLPPGFSRGVVL